MVPFIRMGEQWGGVDGAGSLGCVKLAMPFRHRNGRVRVAVGYTVPELRGMMKAGM